MFTNTRFLLFFLLGVSIFSCRKENAFQSEQSRTGNILIENSKGALIVLGTKEVYDYRQVYFLAFNDTGSFLYGNQFGEPGISSLVGGMEHASEEYGVVSINQPRDIEKNTYRYAIIDSLGIPEQFVDLSHITNESNWTYRPEDMVYNDNYTYLVIGSYRKNHQDWPYAVYFHQNGTVYQEQLYDFNEPAQLLAICPVENNENMAVGLLQDGDLLLTRLNHKGDTLWTKKQTYDKTIQPQTILRKKNQDLVVAGICDQFVGNTFLSTFSADGTLIWTNYFNGTLPKNKGLIANQDEELVMVLNQGKSFDLVRLNETGEVSWKVNVSPENCKSVQVNHLSKSISNDWLVLGNLMSENGVSHIYLAKFDSSGNQLWKTIW